MTIQGNFTLYSKNEKVETLSITLEEYGMSKSLIEMLSLSELEYEVLSINAEIELSK